LPVISALAQTRSRWRIGGLLASFSRTGRKPPVGTTFSFGLNEQANVTFTFAQQLPGRRVRGKCVAPAPRSRSKHSCRRSITRGELSFTAHAGANHISFDGRLSLSKKLTPGQYLLIADATDRRGQRAAPQSLQFTIAR
jgi:hypothetical protein